MPTNSWLGMKLQVKTLKRLLLVWLCLAFQQQVYAQHPIFVTIAGGDLYELDIYNCTSRFIGSTNTQFGDIAFTPDGRLWGFVGNSLYNVDTATADTTLIGDISQSCVSLVALNDSTLLFEFNEELYGLSTNDASTYFIGNIGYQASGDLIWYDDDLYMTSGQDLIKIVLNSTNSAVVSAGPVNGSGITIPDCEGLVAASFKNEDNKLVGFSATDAIKICPIDASNSVICPNIMPGGVPGAAALRLAVQKPKPSSCNRPKLTGIAVIGDTCKTLTVEFRAQGKSSSAKLFWSFGDSASGSKDTLTADTSQSTKHNFTKPGQYTVCVNPVGTPSRVCRTVSVGLCCNGTIRSLDTCLQSQTFFSIISSLKVDSIQWDFGDIKSGGNNFSKALNPTHAFSAIGSYTVSATVYTACRTFTTSSTLTIVNCSDGPTAINITGDSCSLLREMKIVGKSLSSYFMWNFGDTASGTKDTALMYAWNDTMFPQHVFSKPGSYNVCVTFAEPGKDTTTLCATVKVGICCDGMIISYDTCLQNRIVFSFVANNTPDSILWDFGDTASGKDNQSKNLKPDHTFTSVGKYQVNVIVYLPCGILKRSFQKTIVNCDPALCTGDINCNDTCLNTGASFSINSSYPVLSVSWDFDDPASGANNTSQLLQIKHTFSSVGSYRVQAIVRFNCGIDTLFRTVVMLDCRKDTIRDTIQPQPSDTFLIKIPNVFTPGQDGFNDVFDIMLEGESYYFLSIYNRWGILVHEQTNDNDNNWNGRVRNLGMECPAGTYYFLFDYASPGTSIKQESGIISLIR